MAHPLSDLTRASLRSLQVGAVLFNLKPRRPAINFLIKIENLEAGGLGQKKQSMACFISDRHNVALQKTAQSKRNLMDALSLPH